MREMNIWCEIQNADSWKLFCLLVSEHAFIPRSTVWVQKYAGWCFSILKSHMIKVIRHTSFNARTSFKPSFFDFSIWSKAKTVSEDKYERGSVQHCYRLNATDVSWCSQSVRLSTFSDLGTNPAGWTPRNSSNGSMCLS